MGILSPVAVLSLGAVLAGSRGATAADPDGPPPDGKLPRTWEEMYKRHGGDLPSGTYNVHKTAPNGTDDFSTVPVDRKGKWTIDAKGNVTAH